MATSKARHPGGRPRRRVPCEWGKRIEEMAKARGLNRTKLAERVGIHYVSMWQLIMGETRPTMETACKLADALRVPLDKLR